MLHPWRDYEAMLEQVGFTRLERFADLPLNHGLIVARK
jgi:hypothetical protein